MKRFHPPLRQSWCKMSSRHLFVTPEPTPSPVTATITPRLNIDTAVFSGSANGLSNNTTIRRAELLATGTLYDDWAGTLLVDIIEGDVTVFDAYMAYSGFDPVTLFVGNYKEPFSMGEMVVTQNTTFLERPLAVVALSPAYHLGAWARYVECQCGLDVDQWCF